MTEKEKMIAGELYIASGEELTLERAVAARICGAFNAGGAQGDLLSFFGGAGVNITVMPAFRCEYGYNIFLGNTVFMNYDCIILDLCPVKIGDGTLIAPRVGIYTATHPIDPKIRASGLEYAKPITIGKNVWIGAGAIICPGVDIGDNTTIGAGSVVTRGIPANTVAVGNPCRVIRELNYYYPN